MAELHAIVGDIHGHYDALRRLEDRVVRHAEREGHTPKFVCVGDLVDRGPQSAHVVGYLRQACAAGTHVVLMGNHEQMMLLTLHAQAPHLLRDAGVVLPDGFMSTREVWERKEGPSSRWLPHEAFAWYQALSWLTQGGVPTLTSYGTEVPTDPSTWKVDVDDVRFLAQLPLIWSHGDHVATHGLPAADAITDLDSLDRTRKQKATVDVLWGRARPKAHPVPGKVHVSGHTPLPEVRRRRHVGTVQVDTGAFMGRKLSAWCAETDKVVSVAVPLG